MKNWRWTKDDTDTLLFAIAVIAGWAVAILLFASLAAYQVADSIQTLHGAPYDWYPQDQTNQTSFTRGFDGERYRPCTETGRTCKHIGRTRLW